MPDTLAGLPYQRLSFDKEGRPIDKPAQLWPSDATDIVVVSHGWHQDGLSAEDMYADMLRHMQEQAAGALAGRKFAAVGIFWPSDKYRDDLSLELLPNMSVTGGASAAGGDDLDPAKLTGRAAGVAALLGLDREQLETLALRAAMSDEDADELVTLLRGAVAGDDGVDAQMRDEHHDLLDASIPGRDLKDVLSSPAANAEVELGEDVGAAGFDQDEAQTGGAVGLLSGARAAIAKLLNQFAYFELKKRAGVVGEGLARTLDASGAAGRRIHLVGHSFGARLVTMTAARMQSVNPFSLTLLQGAFSHNSLAADIPGVGKPGAFHGVIAEGRVAKQIIATHTWNDTAVGLAYAAASRVSRDVASGFVKVSDDFGGAKDKFGGIGANGALHIGAKGRHTPYDGQGKPPLGAEKVQSLKCDFIKGHSDIRTAAVGRILAAAVT